LSRAATCDRAVAKRGRLITGRTHTETDSDYNWAGRGFLLHGRLRARGAERASIPRSPADGAVADTGIRDQTATANGARRRRGPRLWRLREAKCRATTYRQGARWRPDRERSGQSRR